MGSAAVSDCFGIQQSTAFALRPRRNPTHYIPSGLVPSLTSADFDMIRQLYTFDEIDNDDDDSTPEWIDDDDDDGVPERIITEQDVLMFFKTRNSHKDGEEGEIICVVCQDELHQDKDCKVATLECHHEFHQHCITKWLQNKTFCPICRKQLEDLG